MKDDIKPIFDKHPGCINPGWGDILPGYDSVGDDMLGGVEMGAIRAPGWDSIRIDG